MRYLGAAAILLVAMLAFSPARGDGPKQMELVSRLGRRANVKLYSGESLTFRAREVRDGLSGIFDSGDFLRGVSFRLVSWPRVKQDAIAMLKGTSRTTVREKKKEPDLWGLPASFFTVEDEKPGRYVLEARKAGYRQASVVLDCASFAILVNDGELTDRHYTANFDVELEDPSEKGKAIPILVESLDENGAAVDSRSDLRLAPVSGKAHTYRTNLSVNLSSRVAESFRERRKRADKDPLPPTFYATKPLRIVEGGMIRITLRNLNAVYPLPLGY